MGPAHSSSLTHLPFTLRRGPGPLYSPAVQPRPGEEGPEGGRSLRPGQRAQEAPAAESRATLGQSKHVQGSCPPSGVSAQGSQELPGLRDRPGFQSQLSAPSPQLTLQLFSDETPAVPASPVSSTDIIYDQTVSPHPGPPFPDSMTRACSSAESGQKGLRVQTVPLWIPQSPSRHTV